MIRYTLLAATAVHILSEVLDLDEELKRQLEWMNANLIAAVKNQAILYAELEKIEERLREREADG